MNLGKKRNCHLYRIWNHYQEAKGWTRASFFVINMKWNLFLKYCTGFDMGLLKVLVIGIVIWASSGSQDECWAFVILTKQATMLKKKTCVFVLSLQPGSSVSLECHAALFCLWYLNSNIFNLHSWHVQNMFIALVLVDLGLGFLNLHHCVPSSHLNWFHISCQSLSVLVCHNKITLMLLH